MQYDFCIFRQCLNLTSDGKITKIYILNRLCQNAEQLEVKCDDLTKQTQDLNRQCEFERRKNEKILKDKLKQAETGTAGVSEKVSLRPVNHFVDPNASNDGSDLVSQYSAYIRYQSLILLLVNVFIQLNHSSSGPEGISFAFPSPRSGLGASNSFASSSMSGTDVLDGPSFEHSEEFNQTVNELEATRRQCHEEQQRVSELTEQLNALSKL